MSHGQRSKKHSPWFSWFSVLCRKEHWLITPPRGEKNIDWSPPQRSKKHWLITPSEVKKTLVDHPLRGQKNIGWSPPQRSKKHLLATPSEVKKPSVGHLLRGQKNIRFNGWYSGETNYNVGYSWVARTERRRRTTRRCIRKAMEDVIVRRVARNVRCIIHRNLCECSSNEHKQYTTRLVFGTHIKLKRFIQSLDRK